MNNNAELLTLAGIDESLFTCNVQVACPYKERSLSYALGVNIEVPAQDPAEVFKECCYIHNIFADASSTSDFKNDYSSFYHQRQLSNETVDFILFDFETSNEITLNDSTYGQFFDFGTFSENTNLKGYLVEWKKVLSILGEGSYKVITRITRAAIQTEINSITYTLRQFSESLADKTCRIDIVMNGLLEKSGVDFTGTGWKDSIRVPGFFGRREFQLEEDNIINRAFEKRQIQMKQTNEYKFQTNYIPDCVSNQIIDFMLMANDIYFNDYNLNNHSYGFIKFPAKVANNDGSQYVWSSRKVRLNITFNDKFENNLKRNYN